jgi:hypothetical protein
MVRPPRPALAPGVLLVGKNVDNPLHSVDKAVNSVDKAVDNKRLSMKNPPLNNVLEVFADQFADRVAQRLHALQRAEAERDRTIHLTPVQMAERLNVSVKTLTNMRSLKRGPPFIKVGRSVRYVVSGE